jgi:hypothetical protein
MLILRREEGQWTRAIHRPSGDVLPIRVVRAWWQDGVAHVELAFDDPAHLFTIERPESRSARRRDRDPSPRPPPHSTSG